VAREPRRLSGALAALVLASGVLACGGGKGGTGGPDGGAAGTGGSADGGAGTVACTIQTGIGNPPAVTTTCIETSGVTAAAADYLRAGCTSDAGTTLQQSFANGPCSHDGVIGGCTTASAGGEVTTKWWYDDSNLTSADVSSLCQTLGDAFVSP
jgi:hypothetical protein